MEEKKEKEGKASGLLFTKAQIMASEKYESRRDLISAVLEDGKSYTLAQVDAAMNSFLKGKVTKRH